MLSTSNDVTYSKSVIRFGIRQNESYIYLVNGSMVFSLNSKLDTHVFLIVYSNQIHSTINQCVNTTFRLCTRMSLLDLMDLHPRRWWELVGCYRHTSVNKIKQIYFSLKSSKWRWPRNIRRSQFYTTSSRLISVKSDQMPKRCSMQSNVTCSRHKRDTLREFSLISANSRSKLKTKTYCTGNSFIVFTLCQ